MAVIWTFMSNVLIIEIWDGIMSDVLMKRSSICGADLAPRSWNENWELDWYIAQEISKWNEVKIHVACNFLLSVVIQIHTNSSFVYLNPNTLQPGLPNRFKLRNS